MEWREEVEVALESISAFRVYYFMDVVLKQPYNSSKLGPRLFFHS